MFKRYTIAPPENATNGINSVLELDWRVIKHHVMVWTKASLWFYVKYRIEMSEKSSLTSGNSTANNDTNGCRGLEMKIRSLRPAPMATAPLHLSISDDHSSWWFSKSPLQSLDKLSVPHGNIATAWKSQSPGEGCERQSVPVFFCWYFVFLMLYF